jgi:hypothetical protein
VNCTALPLTAKLSTKKHSEIRGTALEPATRTPPPKLLEPPPSAWPPVTTKPLRTVPLAVFVSRTTEKVLSVGAGPPIAPERIDWCTKGSRSVIVVAPTWKPP